MVYSRVIGKRVGIVAAALGLWLTLGAGVTADPVVDRPNIVLIISDDQGYNDLGFMGHPVVQTPHLDRLAEQSARYANGYVVSSLCRPSLATLLTGQYQHEHGIHFNHPPPGFGEMRRLDADTFVDARAEAEHLIREAPSLPRILAEHGYRTLQTGKHWEGDYANAGFTHGMTRNEPSDAAHGNLELPSGDVVAHGNGDAGLAIGRETMEPIYRFIAEAQRAERPFFIWYAPFLPHTPHDAPQRFIDLYDDRPEVPDLYVPYYAACTWFDETVGELIDHLEQQGLAEDTLFVFIIDNGWEPHPEHPQRMSERSKRSPFEMGIRTPVLIRWDGGDVEPDHHAGLVSSVDIVPTILSAASLNSVVEQEQLPGIDLMPSARREQPLDERRPVFGAQYPGDATAIGQPEDDAAYRWVRQGEYKLLVPHPGEDGRYYRGYLREPALYNVVRDPNERDNLIGEPEHRHVREHLQRLLDDWWAVER